MTELYPQKCTVLTFLGPVVCKALHRVITLPFASAEVIPDFNIVSNSAVRTVGEFECELR